MTDEPITDETPNEDEAWILATEGCPPAARIPAAADFGSADDDPDREPPGDSCFHPQQRGAVT